MRIDDFYLSENERAALLSYSQKDTFPQTLLIEGGNMDERTDFARFIANMIVCQSESGKPCGKCSACIKCEAHSHPDIKEYGEEKERYTFKVELSREIRSDAFVIPNDSDKKVYIIKEAQNMNDSSENALLKILEEPPYFDYFILTCSSRSAMLDTVLSRAVVLSLGFSEENYDSEVLGLCEGIINALCADSELKMLEKLAPLADDKDAFLPVVGCLKRSFLEALKFKNGAAYQKTYENSVKTLSNKYSVNRLYSLITAAGELEANFRQNANYNLLVTYMSARLTDAVK